MWDTFMNPACADQTLKGGKMASLEFTDRTASPAYVNSGVPKRAPSNGALKRMQEALAQVVMRPPTIDHLRQPTGQEAKVEDDNWRTVSGRVPTVAPKEGCDCANCRAKNEAKNIYMPADLPDTSVKFVPDVGVKLDLGKLRWDLLPMELVEEVVKVLTFGANKYSDNNWKKLDNGVERCYAAVQRHLVAWRKGENLDEETGLRHLAHAMCELLFVMHFTK